MLGAWRVGGDVETVSRSIGEKKCRSRCTAPLSPLFAHRSYGLTSTIESIKAVCTRTLLLAPVAALLLSVALLLSGNGLLGTLLAVRAGQEQFPNGVIGAMMSADFAGFTVGALFLPRVIISVGHVRTFAGFAAIASMTALLHIAWVEPRVWMPLRMVTGFAYAGMILATESWLNAHAVPSTRGQLLSIFGVVSMGSWALGQALLNIASPERRGAVPDRLAADIGSRRAYHPVA